MATSKSVNGLTGHTVQAGSQRRLMSKTITSKNPADLENSCIRPVERLQSSFMGRDPDPTIKVALLQKILQYLLEHGVQNLSLRPLAKVLGTNARMLIYHFGSKEQLIIEALELAQQYQIEGLTKRPKPKANSEAELAYLWQWFSSDDFLAFGKLLFEVEVLGMNGNKHYSAFARQIIEGWVSFIQTRFNNCNASTANIIVNTFSGFLLDLLITNDTKRVNASFKTFSALLVKGRNL